MNHCWKQPKIGSIWHGGKLKIFSKSSILVIRPWGKSAGAWKKSKTKPWRGIRSSFDIGSAFDLSNDPNKNPHFAAIPPDLFFRGNLAEFKQKPFVRSDLCAPELLRLYYALVKDDLNKKEMMKSIPEEIRNIIFQVKNEQWLLLQFFNRVGKNALELWNSNPALAYLLACKTRYWQCAHPWRKTRSLVRKKQRYILSSLGHPAEEWILKLLHKIPPTLFSPSLLHSILKQVKKPKMAKQWQHISLLHPAMQESIYHGLSPKLMERVMKKLPQDKRQRGFLSISRDSAPSFRHKENNRSLV